VTGDTSQRAKKVGLGSVLAVATFGLSVWQVPEVHDFVLGKDEVKRVVTLLDGSMKDAATGRRRMQELNVEVNHCRMRPARAAERVDLLVRENRKAVLDDISEVESTTDSEAQTLVEAFRKAMTWSERTDTAYASWLRSWDSEYVDLKEQGCTGLPFDGTAWQVFSDRDQSAGDAKTGFLNLYNPVAKKYGFRHDWKPPDF
jgi:hypothetical protein